MSRSHSPAGFSAPKIQQLPLLLTDLPPELVAQVLGLLDDRSLALVVPTCRAFRDSLMPRLWVSRLRQRFPHSSWDSCGAPCRTLACLSLLHKTAWEGARAGRCRRVAARRSWRAQAGCPPPTPSAA